MLRPEIFIDMSKTDKDIAFMRQAIALAQKGRGRTSPNPMVGCVLVKAGRVIARGWHRACGQDHAEIDALKKAGTASRGAEMYVTLEPCFHYGRTPPCVDAVIKAGVRRVVIGMVDPNPLTAGKSLRKLRRAGVEVCCGVCEDELLQLNAAFIKYMTTGLPFVTAKIAQTLDGRVACRGGDSKWITSDQTREKSRGKRFLFDAIVTGVNTVLMDNPRLDVNGKPLVKVVLDSSLRIPLKARLFDATADGQVILATTRKAPAALITSFRQRRVDVIVCPRTDSGVDLGWLLCLLGKRGLINILVEGGPKVIGSALKKGLVDRLHLYVAPKLLGDDQARGSVSGLMPAKISRAFPLRFLGVEQSFGDLFIEAEVLHVHRNC